MGYCLKQQKSGLYALCVKIAFFVSECLTKSSIRGIVVKLEEYSCISKTDAQRRCGGIMHRKEPCADGMGIK